MPYVLFVDDQSLTLKILHYLEANGKVQHLHHFYCYDQIIWGFFCHCVLLLCKRSLAICLCIFQEALRFKKIELFSVEDFVNVANGFVKSALRLDMYKHNASMGF